MLHGLKAAKDSELTANKTFNEKSIGEFIENAKKVGIKVKMCLIFGLLTHSLLSDFGSPCSVRLKLIFL